MSAHRRSPAALLRAAGMGLIELLVSLVIGIFLILGAVAIYSQSRNSYRSFETVARLQETARYALDTIEADARMASYWGLLSRPEYVTNKARPSEDLPADLAAAGAVIAACANNWVIDLDAYIAGWNGPDGYGLACDAYQDSYRAGTDGLIVRRAADTAAETLAGGRLYLQSSRIHGTIFLADATCTNPKVAACIPAGYSPPLSETRELLAVAYYVAERSVGQSGVPALRRKRLVTGSMLDEEVIPGVEDLQLRFGIDTDSDTNADAYVDPAADPTAYGGRIVAVTIWLRVRAEEPEPGVIDDRAYRYADLDEPAPNDRFRRVVVSRTISLRNTRS